MQSRPPEFRSGGFFACSCTMAGSFMGDHAPRRSLVAAPPMTMSITIFDVPPTRVIRACSRWHQLLVASC